jgi:hypothetical protein
MDILGLQDRAPSFTRKEKEDSMYIELADTVDDRLNRWMERFAARAADVILAHVTIESPEQQQIRLARARTLAEQQWQRDAISRDLAHKDATHRWLESVHRPDPRMVPPGGWY